MGFRPWSRLQERVESSDLGRALISALVLVTLVVMVAENLPRSKLRRELVRVADPYLDAVGLEQVWGVFAPDPRKRVLMLEARVRLADGSTAVWKPPHGWPFPDAYRDVRWRKWAEAAAVDSRLLPPAALWVARRFADEGLDPTQVELVRRTYLLLPPGESPSRTPWTEETIYTLRVPAGLSATEATS